MLTADALVARNNITVMGSGETTLLMAHGFGCSQTMWHHLMPELKDQYTLILFDYVGAGQSQLSAYQASRYSTLEGHARDINEICEALDLKEVHLVSHSVSTTIGLIAMLAAPERFASHVMVCPSPCFMNMPPDYPGGFERSDLEELIDLMARNHIGWATYLAPILLGGAGSPPLIGELSDSFCSTDPLVAQNFARCTFFSDYRYLLPHNQHPTLLLQSGEDALASTEIGHFMARQMPHSRLNVLPTEGHCVHMTHPKQVGDAIHHWFVSTPSMA